MKGRASRRIVITGAFAAAMMQAGCDSAGPRPIQVVEFGGKSVKVFVDGVNATSAITTSIPDGGSWSGDINGVAIAVRQGQLSIGGKPYTGPAFSELHVVVKPGGTVETKVARN